MEQKWVFYLSIFTVLFNDPLYAATILAPNGFTYIYLLIIEHLYQSHLLLILLRLWWHFG